MTWPDVEEALEDTRTLLLPVGNTEQHGHHLPLGVDTFTPLGVCERVATDVDCFLAPPIWYGVAPHHMVNPGSFTVDSQPFQNYIKGVCTSAAEWGIENILLLNGHYRGHDNELNIVVRTLREDHGIRAFNVPLHRVFKDAAQEVRDSEAQGHGAEFETSMLLALHPNLVHMDRAVPSDIPVNDGFEESSEPLPLFDYDTYGDTRVSSALTTEAMANITPDGTIGDPTLGSAEKGHALLEDATANIAKFVTALEEG
jgi:creatinine amidohydrolase